jgi:integrase
MRATARTASELCGLCCAGRSGRLSGRASCRATWLGCRPLRASGPVRAGRSELPRELLDAAAGYRFEAAVVLALAYGMRRGEVLGLHWSALDWQARTRCRSGERAFDVARSEGLEPPTF